MDQPTNRVSEVGLPTILLHWKFSRKNGTHNPHTVYGRFARCPVRPESFRPDPESIRPDPESIRPEPEVVSPGAWSRFARSMKSFRLRVENKSFSIGNIWESQESSQVRDFFWSMDGWMIEPVDQSYADRSIKHLWVSLLPPRAMC